MRHIDYYKLKGQALPLSQPSRDLSVRPLKSHLLTYN
jgi:hypothetical protein